jgi:hydrogenase maturation factor
MSESRKNADPLANSAAPCDDPTHCITCSDEGTPMRVLSVDADGTLGWCESERGEKSEVLMGLIENALEGDTLLVHAGTALIRLRRAAELGS